MFVYMLFILHVSFPFSPAKIQLFFYTKNKNNENFSYFYFCMEMFVYGCLHICRLFF